MTSHNDFTLFGLEPAPELRTASKSISLEQLRAAYLKMQALCHPDQAQATDLLSARINQAYQRLRRPVERVRLWLELQGIALDQSQSADESAFVLQMELTEAVSESAELSAAERTKLCEKLQAGFELHFAKLASLSKSSSLDQDACIQAFGQLMMYDRLLNQLRKTTSEQ